MNVAKWLTDPEKPGMKTCKICRNQKPLRCFDKHPTARFGVKQDCKECHSALSRAERHKRLRERGKEPNQIRVPVKSKTKTQGDNRDDGMVFWAMERYKGKLYERWVTPERFTELRKAVYARRRWRSKNDPTFLEGHRNHNARYRAKNKSKK